MVIYCLGIKQRETGTVGEGCQDQALTDYIHYYLLIIINIERFSIECRKTKTKTKAITMANHNKRKQHNEPMRI